MSGDIECSEGCGRCHSQRYVGSDVLPVCLPDSVHRDIARARANTSDTDNCANDGQDAEAEG